MINPKFEVNLGQLVPEDQLPPIEPEPAIRKYELTCRGKPAQVATSLANLANTFAEQYQGYAPFFFWPQQAQWKPGAKIELDPNALRIEGIGVYPTEPSSATSQPRVPDQHLGWIDLVAIGQDAKGADLCLLVFRCQEREWPQFVDPWNRLVDELRRLGVLAQRSTIEPKQALSTAPAMAVEAETGDTVANSSGGRPPDKDYDWAFDQIYIQKRPWEVVAHEWQQRIPPRRLRKITDPELAFYKAMKRRFDKWEGRNS